MTQSRSSGRRRPRSGAASPPRCPRLDRAMAGGRLASVAARIGWGRPPFVEGGLRFPSCRVALPPHWMQSARSRGALESLRVLPRCAPSSLDAKRSQSWRARVASGGCSRSEGPAGVVGSWSARAVGRTPRVAPAWRLCVDPEAFDGRLVRPLLGGLGAPRLLQPEKETASIALKTMPMRSPR